MIEKEESVLQKMLPELGQLSSLERKVASYLIKHEEEILSLEIAEIGEKTKVSKATVVRFCKALGYQGLKEFKVAYQSQKSQYNLIPKAITTSSSNQEIFNTIIISTIRTLEKLNNKDTADTLSLFADRAFVAGKVLIVSNFDSLYNQVIKEIFLSVGVETEIITYSELNQTRENANCPILCLNISKEDTNKVTTFIKNYKNDKFGYFLISTEDKSYLAVKATGLVFIEHDKISAIETILLKDVILTLLNFVVSLIGLKKK